MWPLLDIATVRASRLSATTTCYLSVNSENSEDALSVSVSLLRSAATASRDSDSI